MLLGVSPEQLATNLRLRPIAMNSGLTPGALFRTDLPGYHSLLYPRPLFKGTKLVPRRLRSAEPRFTQSRRAQPQRANLTLGSNGRLITASRISKFADRIESLSRVLVSASCPLN